MSNLPSLPVLRQEAARCVACGLCLPHCPTYRKTLNEAESPRGRIFMMAAALEGHLQPTPELLGHLDLCLTCRACENVCPSQVRYGKLADGVRAWIEPQRRRPLGQRLLRWVLFGTAARPRLLEIVGGMLRLAARFGPVRAATRLPALPPPPRPGIYPAQGRVHGSVGLFLGCIARHRDAHTLVASIFVLTRLGYTVHVAENQTCCGALHQHNGELATSARLAEENRRALAGPGLSVILHAASGCAATLGEYDPPLPAPLLDVSTFLARAQGWDQVRIVPLEETIALHEPCSSRNVLHDQGASYALLRRIPGATVMSLGGNDQCCGAAGIYALTQPEMAGLLLRDKIDAIRASGARYIATSNPGCAMHMAAGLHAAGHEISVLHPVSLVARQMGYEYD